MNVLISCDGTYRATEAAGQRVLAPRLIARRTSDRREITDAVYEYAGHDGRSITYRESYWEVPRLGGWIDSKGRHRRLPPEPGVYYYPESADIVQGQDRGTPRR